MDPVEGNRGAREEILGRIRTALEAPVSRSTFHVSGSETITGSERMPAQRETRNVEPQTLLRLFQSQCAANAMETIVTADAAATAAALHQVIASLPPGEIFVQDAPELRSLDLPKDRKLRWSGEGAPAESSQATVSLCEALVAASGSVLVSSAGGGGRGASVVAPCHIVLARAEQLVPDFEAVMERARQIAFDSSFVGLITGSSRTADIEKKLIIGAHGPGRLVVIVQIES